MAKETYIELECKDGRKRFSVEHADGILRMKFHGSWRLPEDSEWTWSAERGFEKKVSQKAQKGQKGTAENDEGEAALNAAATDKGQNSTAENGGEKHE